VGVSDHADHGAEGTGVETMNKLFCCQLLLLLLLLFGVGGPSSDEMSS
jgi:hypothetical protein